METNLTGTRTWSVQCWPSVHTKAPKLSETLVESLDQNLNVSVAIEGSRSARLASFAPCEG